MPARGNTAKIADCLALIAVFGVAMGYLEAVVVVYIRRIVGLVPMPEGLDVSTIRQMPEWLVATEQTREAATIIMLVAFAWLVGRDVLGRIATFLIAFGVWDLAYYASLKALLDWPASLSTMDCLFLIPRPWLAPVWQPMAASTCLVLAGGALLVAAKRRSA